MALEADEPQPAGAGPHSVHLTHDDKRLVVSDYFLDQDDFGKVHLDGDHKIHAIDIVNDHLVEDANFKLGFNRDIPTGPARPHGVTVVRR